MNQNPAWRNLLVAAVIAVGLLLALPNIFGDTPAIQVGRAAGQPLDDLAISQAETLLAAVSIETTETYTKEGRFLLTFADGETQSRAQRVLADGLGKSYIVALTRTPKTPGWMRSAGLEPMSLGLDLRGGVHFVFEIDMEVAIRQRLDILANDVSRRLREERIRRNVRVSGDEIRIRVGDPADLNRAEQLVAEFEDGLDIRRSGQGENEQIIVRMTEEQVRARQDFAVDQNMVVLRQRVDEVGVAEPVVQRQGRDRIVVQLPGVDDPSEAKGTLDARATLEFRMVCEGQNAFEAQRRGRAPLGCELFADREGQPVLLKRGTIVTGDQLIDANATYVQGSPAVNVRLNSGGAASMLRTTSENVGKPMAVLYVVQEQEIIDRDGEQVAVTRTDREVINVATIQGVFSSSFQITGLDAFEAPLLARLLRSGALAAPLYIVEERTIGPSLGQDNIDSGFTAIQIGLVCVILFMALYYRVFGIVADLALFAKLVLIVAILSMLQASLTLPGIAGIVLTVGMAVDANVLIFERIREELRNGNSPQASIHSGYEKALSTIADANVTTLIAAVVLFAFGTGPIKGFAITLSVGIATSMFTSIIGTRTVINLLYGGRRLDRLPI